MEPIKTLTNIKTKGELYELFAYKSGYEKKLVQLDINQIICKSRNIDMNTQPKKINLQFNEVLMFLAKYGAPRGYKLSQELEEKIQKLKL